MKPALVTSVIISTCLALLGSCGSKPTGGSESFLTPWQSLAKKQTSLLTLFLTFRDGELDPRDMLRHSQLNPRDRELSGRDRAHLVAKLVAASKQIPVMRKAQRSSPRKSWPTWSQQAEPSV